MVAVSKEIINPIIDGLNYRAKYQPHSVAIQFHDKSMSYSYLSNLVKRIAKKLREVGIKPGDLVMTSLPVRAFDILITLGLFHEGAVSCSNQARLPLQPNLKINWLITDKKYDNYPDSNTVIVDDEWLRALDKDILDVEPQSYKSIDSICRLVLTSGTTGKYKAVNLTIDQTLTRCQVGHELKSSYGHELCMLGMATSSGYYYFVNHLMMGLPIFVFRDVREIYPLIANHSINSVYASPVQIIGLLKGLIANGVSVPASLQTFFSGGSAISSKFCEIITKKFNRRLINIYGASEVGMIGAVEIRGVGEAIYPTAYVLPDVDVQVVDDSGNLLPESVEGSVRIRTPYMTQQYYENPEMTALSFRDGWFYPGDRGYFKPDGLLFLAGRDSELINRGGPKINPVEIDEILLKHEGVLDAATFGFENPEGISDMAAALVIAEGFDLKNIQKAMLETVGKMKTPGIFIALTEIPRNEMGKIKRHQLGQDLTEKLRNKEK